MTRLDCIHNHTSTVFQYCCNFFCLKVKEDEKEKLEEFFKINHYVSGAYDSPAAFENLNTEITKLETTNECDRIFYLALPPSVFIPVTQMVKDHCESKT